ncbi:MAG: carboxypeptidase regulatory-like domain-containing protein [Bryobacteraceae bacterium]|nr:carboxypeptidase regulatory-like domain-containing protein [Bryobacteraceae bacterium]
MNRRITATFLLFAAAVWSQGTGTIHGTATDPSGAAVVNATVTALLVNRGASRTVVTNERGEYVFPLLALGAYTVTIESQGFTQYRREGVELNANENVRVDAQLSLGGTAETVQVTGEAPLVDSRSSVVSTLIDARRVTEIPTNGRNVVQLALMLPGVTQVTAPQAFTGDREGPRVSISGSRSNQNLFLLDGAHFGAHFRNSGLNYPPPDALQEMKVLTNSFSAEYGRNSGAVFNVVTRSGTNSLHGSAWEFFRNHNLNARNFFAPGNPRLVQNQFGGTAGGPIRKNKLFAFGSYEGLRVRQAALVTGAFPLTDAERQGVFSTTVRDPLTNQPFPNNRIPADRFDKVATNLLGKMPLPNRADGSFVSTYPSPLDNNSLLTRLDYTLGLHSIEGRYYYNKTSNQNWGGQIPEYFPQVQSNTTQAWNIGDTWVMKPTLINQFRVSFTRNFNDIDVPLELPLSSLGANFPILGTNGPSAIVLTGRVNLGDGSGLKSLNVNESFHLNESMNWTRGNHTIKGGFEMLHLRYLNRAYWQSAGVFTFSGQISGSVASDFLLGRPSNLQVASPAIEQAGLQGNYFFYLQDDWRISRRLTLNLGVRYELPLPWVQPNDMVTTFKAGVQSTVYPQAPRGILFPGDAGVSRGLIATDKNNWAPRFGFAYDLTGNGRTSLRGAYGIFYEGTTADIIQNTGQPWRYTFTIPTPFSLTDPLRGQTPIPAGLNRNNPIFTGIQDLAFADPNFRSGYVQNFNMNIQRQVGNNLAIQVGYVGRLGRKLIMGLDANPAIYGPGATLANLNSRRVYQGFGNVRSISSLANSHYHGLQIEATKRYSRGFSIQGAYTWSRAIDMRSSLAAVGAATPDVFNLRTEYGLSDFHAAHVANISWLWEIPAASKSGFLRFVTGGWQLNGLATWRTGLPINVVSGRDNMLSGSASQRPNVTGNPVLASDRPRAQLIDAWFDRTAFTQPATGTQGNVGRNALIGPGNAVLNLGVFRSFPLPLREGMRLQFRSEFFNALNQVNLNNPNANLNAGNNTGRITGAGAARVIQLALKLSF